MDTDRARATQGALLRDARVEARTRLAALDRAIAELRHDRSVDTADDEHDPEGVTLSVEWARLTGLRSAAAADLADLDEAQGRWDAGTYGSCVDCGRGIPIERLRVRPAASRCVDCAARAGG